MRNFFPKLLGNEDTKIRVGTAIDNGTAAHAFLLDGPRGSGKMTLATEIAAAMNCEEKKNKAEPLPCGKCNSCKRIYSGNFPDVKILEKPKDRASIGVEAVKDFREDMFLSSTESDYKIYIIKDAQTMTVESQNALLKVLEEPPRGVLIILLAEECDKILTTIKSRVQYISMSRFDGQALREHLLTRSPDAQRMSREEPEKFAGIIMSADGRLGRAQMLTDKKLSEENEAARKDVLAIISVISSRAFFSDIYSAVSLLPQKRQELLLSLESVISALRDLVVLKEDKDACTVFFINRDEALRFSKDISIKRLLTVYDAVNEAHELCSKNANVTNVLTNLASKIKLGISR